MAKSDRLIDKITFHFCFAKCFRIFDVTTLVISFVEAMPPEILKNSKFKFLFSSMISKNSGQQKIYHGWSSASWHVNLLSGLFSMRCRMKSLAESDISSQ